MIVPGKLVVDASVAVKWYVPETGSEAASAILARGARLLAPDLLAAEFGNVLWKKVRRGELSSAEAETIIDAFVSTRPIELVQAAPFLGSAFDIATRWDRTVYDALYIAVALAEGCCLVTADGRLAESLRGTALAKTVLVLPGS